MLMLEWIFTIHLRYCYLTIDKRLVLCYIVVNVLMEMSVAELLSESRRMVQGGRRRYAALPELCAEMLMQSKWHWVRPLQRGVGWTQRGLSREAQTK